MKKYVLPLLTALCLVCWGCSSDDDEPTSHYTEKQEKVFAMFSGTWADYQFSNLGGGELGYLLPNPDKIVFGSHYSTPKEIKQSSYLDGEKTAFEAQGECTYYKIQYDGEYIATKCYYNVSPQATVLGLWNVAENRKYETYELKVVSASEFQLHESGITLWYIFRKQ